jgi:cell division protein FtsZ
MNSHLKKHSQEEANRLAEEQERAAKREDRRQQYYGNEGTNKRYKRRPHIYLFRTEDLDNENVISAVESTPTYKRTREILDSINSQTQEDDSSNHQDNDAEVIQGTIKFA